MANLLKDASILAVLARLERELGAGGPQIVDHWDADLFAVGVASPDDPRRLVYISTWKQRDGCFFYECEAPVPTTSDDDVPYEVIESADAADIERLIAAVKRHFRRR